MADKGVEAFWAAHEKSNKVPGTYAKEAILDGLIALRAADAADTEHVRVPTGLVLKLLSALELVSTNEFTPEHAQELEAALGKCVRWEEV